MANFVLLYVKFSLQYANVSKNCLTCTVYIGGESLFEINERMSDLLDNQV